MYINFILCYVILSFMYMYYIPLIFETFLPSMAFPIAWIQPLYLLYLSTIL